MAYVDWSMVDEVDCSEPYKTFNDLKDNDKIYLIDFKNLTIKELIIKNPVKRENNSYKILNRFEVTFEISGVTHTNIIISNGNLYLDRVFINYEESYITTDKRLAESIINLLRLRNTYQWECLTGIFGHPLTEYSAREIKLC